MVKYSQRERWSPKRLTINALSQTMDDDEENVEDFLSDADAQKCQRVMKSKLNAIKRI